MTADQLSAQGQARRTEMLGELRRAVRARRRRRRAAQGALILLPAIALGAISLSQLQRSPSTEPMIQPGNQPGPVAADPSPRLPVETLVLKHISYVAVHTPATPRDYTISDDELLELLRAAGHNAGLIRRGSEVIITGVTLPPPPTPSPSSPSSSSGGMGVPPVSSPSPGGMGVPPVSGPSTPTLTST